MVKIIIIIIIEIRYNRKETKRKEDDNDDDDKKNNNNIETHIGSAKQEWEMILNIHGVQFIVCVYEICFEHAWIDKEHRCDECVCGSVCLYLCLRVWVVKRTMSKRTRNKIAHTNTLTYVRMKRKEKKRFFLLLNARQISKTMWREWTDSNELR